MNFPEEQMKLNKIIFPEEQMKLNKIIVAAFVMQALFDVVCVIYIVYLGKIVRMLMRLI